MGIMFTCQTISGAYFNTAAQSVFENSIYKRLAATAPEIRSSSISEAGAAGLRTTFSGEELALVLEAYMVGIKNVFIFAVAGAAANVLVALFIPPTRIPAPEEKKMNKGNAANAGIDE